MKPALPHKRSLQECDEAYVEEILDAAKARGPLTETDFRTMTGPDVDAGYASEVDEAWRRLSRTGGNA